MQQLVVDGIDIYIDGPEEDEHAETIVMILSLIHISEPTRPY